MAAKSLEGINWDAVKLSAVAGVSIPQLAKVFGINRKTIEKRSLRDAWPLPKRVKSMNVSKTSPEEDSNEIASRTIAEQLAANGDDASLIASQMALAALLRARKSRKGIMPLIDIGDVKTALSTARQAAGMDKQQTAIQVNVGQVWSESLGTEATVRLAN